MRTSETVCNYCENTFEVITESDESIDFCPFCGEYLLEDDEENIEELDFEDE